MIYEGKKRKLLKVGIDKKTKLLEIDGILLTRNQADDLATFIIDNLDNLKTTSEVYG